MSAAEKVTKLSMSPRELADQIQNDVADNGGDTDVVVARLTKEFTGRRRAMLPTVIEEWLITDRKPPKADKKPKTIPTDLEKEAQKLERQARRIRLAGQVDAAAEKRVLMTFIMPNGDTLGECTGDYVARIGGSFSKLGKRGAKWLIKDKYSERDLEKAKIG